MADIQEQFFRAIDEIVKKRIEAVHFDETIKAVIVDATAAADGKYIVDTGAAKFTAYSMTEYKENDTVLVTIPQGNFENLKMIIGKAVSGTDTPLIVKRPFDNFIDLTHNLASSLTNVIDFQANGKDTDYSWPESQEGIINSQTGLKCIWSWGFSNDIDLSPNEEQGYILRYTRLGIQALFSTWLGEYNVMDGNYGLILRAYFKNIAAENNVADNEKYFIHNFILDSDDFFGDPYNFETYYTQELVFDISDLVDYPIVGLKLFAYERDNFLTTSGEKLTYLSDAELEAGFFQTTGSNIFIKDINICFGEASDEFKNDTAEIICDSALTYKKETGSINTLAERATANLKHIQLRWVHEEPETGHIGLVDGSPPVGYEIRWYKYKLGAPSPDKFAGAHWERFYGSKTIADETVQETEVWDNDDSNDITTDELEIDFIPNINLNTELIKAIVIKSEIDFLNNLVESKVATSNILEFTNDDEVRNEVTFIDVNALGIKYEDELLGYYFIYKKSLGLEDDSKADEIHCITPVFDPLALNLLEKANLNIEECYSVTWTFPASSYTMLIPMQYELGSDPNTATLALSNIIDGKVYSVGFRIKKQLDYTYTDNKILLDIVYGGLNYSAFIQPIFGSSGDNGSEYKIVVVWESKVKSPGNNENYDYIKTNALNLSKDSNNRYIDTKSSTEYPEWRGTVCLQHKSSYINIPTDAKLEYNWVVAETGIAVEKTKEKETAKIFYPVFTSENLSLYNGVSNNPDDEDLSGDFYYFLDTSAKYILTTDTTIDINKNYYTRSGAGTEQSPYVYTLVNSPVVANIATYYESPYYKFVYNKNNKKWEFLHSTWSNNAVNLYRKVIDNSELKNKLEFLKISFDPEPYDAATGDTFYGTDNDTDLTTAIQVVNEEKKYYYSNNKKYFILVNNQYVLDPYQEYELVKTYYEPIEILAKKYDTGNLSITEGILPNTTTPTVTIKPIQDANVSMNSIYILEIRLTNFGDYDLIDYSAIPLKNGETINESGQQTFYIDNITGATSVRYGSDGEVDYIKDPYKITARKWNNSTLVLDTVGNGAETNHKLNGTWRILLPEKDNSEKEYTAKELSFVPILKENIPRDNNGIEMPLNKSTVLSPLSVYLPDALPYAVQFLDSDNNILWTLPIVVKEDKYPSTTLNKWQGREIETDKDAGTITASGFAAGKKERDNTFTGVVIGDWSRSDADTSITKHTGVYGFNHGAMSYAFKDDGTGFIGKDGKGRIYLDGDKSLIFSSNWANLVSPQGMLLDVDDGYIKMNSPIISSTSIPVYRQTVLRYPNVDTLSNIILELWRFLSNNPNATFEDIRNILRGYVANESNNFVYIGGDVYKLQNNTYISLGSNTKYTDLSIGTELYTYKMTTELNFITLDATAHTYPLAIGDNKNVGSRGFRVEWNGTTHINNGEFSGTIHAKGGTISGDLTVTSTLNGGTLKADYLEVNYGNIGGWTIGPSSLSGGNTELNSLAGITTNTINIASGTISGKIGFFTGSKTTDLNGTTTSTNLLGFTETSGNGIAILVETKNNIRLSGPGSGQNCNAVFIQSNAILFTAPATAQFGIYARFA